MTGKAGHPLLGPSVLGVASNEDPSGADATLCQSLSGKAPILPLDGPLAPLELSSRGVEETLAGEDGGVQRSFPMFEKPEGARYASDLVTVANLGASGSCRGSGLEGLVDALLRNLEGGPLGHAAEGGGESKLSGGTLWVDSAGAPQPS